MIIEKINKTNSIKKLSLNDKNILSSEIRDYIIDIVSKNGGHLASNLGVVELTIALESVFDLTKDKIIWDVGHQCYTHKILNGRKNELKTLRQLNGISGFPKTKESLTDCFNTGHSSTSISAALGMAKARDISKKDYSVVAVIGDGSLTGGMALEALNHLGCSKTKMIIVLNDNEMSISKNISGMNKLLTRLRTKKNYRKSNEKGKEIVSSIPLVGNKVINGVGKLKGMIKQLFIPKMYFEEIGIKYLGPVDGHNIADLESIFTKAKDFDEPVIIHVLTKKGKGYKYAEENPTKFHGIGPFNIETGETLNKKSLDYSAVFGNKITELAKKNKKIVAITAAMKDGVGLDSFASLYPNHFFDVGIAEQHALTFAAGLAKEGMIPFVSIYSSFYQRCYDQIIHDICLQNLPVIMCVDRAGIVGQDGETHQGILDSSFMKIVPNIVIMAPKNFKELEDMIDFAITLKKPVVIRYPRGGEKHLNLPMKTQLSLGNGEIQKKGKDITIISWGNLVARALSISNKLKENEIDAEVINARFLKPLDTNLIKKSILRTRKVIVLEDSIVLGGLCSSIKELIVDEELSDVVLKTYAYPDEFIDHGKTQELEKKYKIDENSILKDIKRMFK